METPTDKERLDWMDQKRKDCEGRILSRCFIPNDKTLRENIDAEMEADDFGAIPDNDF